MNPWNVDTLEEFLYFCCPECDLRDQSKVTFLQHALEKHPDAKECVLQFNEFIIKEEPCELSDKDNKDININNENFYNIDEDYGEMLECELKYEYNEDSIKNESFKFSSEQDLNPVEIDYINFKEKNLNNVNVEEDGTIKEPYCYLCSKRFDSAWHLKRHNENVHEGIRYKCDICGVLTRKKSMLKYHIETVHEGIKKHKCKLCKKKFQDKQSLRLHVQSVHEGVRHQCDMCEESFSQANNLKLHLAKVHGKGKRSKCTFCDKTYASPSTLKVHIEKVHKEMISLEKLS